MPPCSSGDTLVILTELVVPTANGVIVKETISHTEYNTVTTDTPSGRELQGKSSSALLTQATSEEASSAVRPAQFAIDLSGSWKVDTETSDSLQVSAGSILD
jgi:hypothetical protein